jgi:hypothetical protein
MMSCGVFGQKLNPLPPTTTIRPKLANDRLVRTSVRSIVPNEWLDLADA